jgi:hypothetical protein
MNSAFSSIFGCYLVLIEYLISKSFQWLVQNKEKFGEKFGLLLTMNA